MIFMCIPGTTELRELFVLKRSLGSLTAEARSMGLACAQAQSARAMTAYFIMMDVC